MLRKQLRDIAAGMSGGAAQTMGVVSTLRLEVLWACGRRGQSGLPQLSQVPSSPPGSLKARPTETDTHQGESHEVEKNHRPRPGGLFSISGPAINKLADLGQVTLSPSASCKMSLDSDS